MKDFDLFGNEISKDVFLRDVFLEPPFTVLDTKGGAWRNRKKLWKSIGIESEVSREGINVIDNSFDGEKYGRTTMPTVSIFDPALCELMYRWFCDEGGKILDPFAGGSVRGIVANKLGYKYTGIDIREEQIQSNIAQGNKILGAENCPTWLLGDSDKVLENLDGTYDFIFSCPPYLDLEVYSDLDDDLSTKDDQAFELQYQSIINKLYPRLKNGGLACFVVGDVRDKKGNYRCFTEMTVRCFENAGFKTYNKAVLLQPLGTAMLRANKVFNAGKKLIKVHEDVLIFKKVVTPTKKQTPIEETVKDWKDVITESEPLEPQGFFAELEFELAEPKKEEEPDVELNDLPWEDTNKEEITDGVKIENKYPFEYVELPDYCLLNVYSQQSEILDICKQLAKQYITFKYPGIKIIEFQPMYDEHNTHITLKYITCISEHQIKLSVRVQNIFESLVELYDM
jgi:DNA modification methylase